MPVRGSTERVRWGVIAQWLGEGGGQHGDAIPAALGLPDQDLAAAEVDVLYTQAQALHEAHPGAVQQARQQRVGSIHPGKHRARLLA